MVRLNKRLDPSQTGLEAEKLFGDLRKRIVGQDEAIDQIVNIYQMYLAGMNSPGRPIGNFLFLGPTGTGKTRMVEATAESLIGDLRAMIKIDCAEFQHSHEIAKLIGSPPGYLGHRETHPLLSQEALNQYHTEKIKLSFVLFDEIEKASDTLWQLLLGILDKANLTLGDNRKVDFSKTIIFMASNLGAREISRLVQGSMGFASPATRDAENSELDQKIYRTALGAAKRNFSPEFMNRIDCVVVFRNLSQSHFEEILELELNSIQQRIFQSSPQKFFLRCGDEAKDILLREGIHPTYGARNLKRVLEQKLVVPMANLLATGQLKTGDFLTVDYDRAQLKLVFSKHERVTESAGLREGASQPWLREAATAISQDSAAAA